MTSKLIPSNPAEVMVIRNLTPNVVTLSLPFTRFGLFQIGGRGTIVKLTSGALAVFSPVALTPAVRSTLEQLGNNVRYIAATDLEHHIFITEWAKAFPQASVIGVEGLPEKRASMAKSKDTPSPNPQVPFSHVFTKSNKTSLKISPEFDADFDYEFVESHANKELVFFYRPDRVLIQADLMFNLPATEQYSRTGLPASAGILTKFFNSFQNTRGTAIGQQRFIWYVGSSADRPAFGKSVKRIAGWDFGTIIPCHGDVITTDAKGIFRKVFDWHLKGQSA